MTESNLPIMSRSTAVEFDAVDIVLNNFGELRIVEMRYLNSLHPSAAACRARTQVVSSVQVVSFVPCSVMVMESAWQ